MITIVFTVSEKQTVICKRSKVIVRPIEWFDFYQESESHKKVGISQMFETALKECLRKASTLLTMCD